MIQFNEFPLNASPIFLTTFLMQRQEEKVDGNHEKLQKTKLCK